MTPMYKLWLHSLYGLYGPQCPLSPKRPLNLITHSLTTHFAIVIFVHKDQEQQYQSSDVVYVNYIVI